MTMAVLALIVTVDVMFTPPAPPPDPQTITTGDLQVVQPAGSVPFSASSGDALMADCGNLANALVVSDIATFYANYRLTTHYNSSLDRCFAEIDSSDSSQAHMDIYDAKSGMRMLASQEFKSNDNTDNTYFWDYSDPNSLPLGNVVTPIRFESLRQQYMTE